MQGPAGRGQNQTRLGGQTSAGGRRDVGEDGLGKWRQWKAMRLARVRTGGRARRTLLARCFPRSITALFMSRPCHPSSLFNTTAYPVSLPHWAPPSPTSGPDATVPASSHHFPPSAIGAFLPDLEILQTCILLWPFCSLLGLFSLSWSEILWKRVYTSIVHLRL